MIYVFSICISILNEVGKILFEIHLGGIILHEKIIVLLKIVRIFNVLLVINGLFVVVLIIFENIFMIFCPNHLIRFLKFWRVLRCSKISCWLIKVHNIVCRTGLLCAGICFVVSFFKSDLFLNTLIYL